jgi:cytochrome c
MRGRPSGARIDRSSGSLRRAAKAVIVLLAALATLWPLAFQPSRAEAQGGSEGAASAQKARRASPGNLVGHGGPIKAVRVDAASGRALTGSFDYAMMVWDLSGDEPKELARIDDHGGAVNAVAFLPGGQRGLSAGDDGSLALWDLASGQLVHRFAGHTAKVVGLAVSPDGRWAATASWDRTARLWDLERLAEGPVLTGHAAPVNAVVFSRDGRQVFTASADGTIRLFRREDGAFERPVYKHGWGINVLERLPGSDALVFGALNGAAGILDPAAGEVTVELKSHSRPVLALAVIEKPGLIATGGGDGVIRVFRAGDGAPLQEYQNPFGPVWALAFTAEGRALYYGGLDDFATLWQVNPPAPVGPVDSPFPRRFQVTAQSDDLLVQGEVQFARKCSVCHTLSPDGGNRAGPTLFELFGRRAGSVHGYPYSDALKGGNLVWTEETVSKLFELGPDEFTPGSKMPLQRMTDKKQRDALVAYLKFATRAQSGGPDGQRGNEGKGETR